MKDVRAGATRLGPPIAVQIIGLLVAVLIVGQLAVFALVSVLPPPRPPIYRIEEIAAALKGGSLTPRYAPIMVRSAATAPPRGRDNDNDFRTAGLRTDLARALHTTEDHVRLTVEPRPRFPGIYTGSYRRRKHAEDRMGASPFDEDGPPPRPGDDNALPPPGSGPPPPPPNDPNAAAAWDRPGFGRRPWRGFGSRASQDRMGFVVGAMSAAYEVQPGRWTIVRSPSESFPNAWQRRILLWFLACLLILTPAGYLFARRLTAPIGRFAKAADRLGRDPRGPPMTLRGPAEIGVAAAAFNEMQARLARYVGDRTAMIGAIAHDLRTPLARVQFKLQRAPADLADDIRRDLGQMEDMIAAVLDFVRDASPVRERGPLDLLSLLEVVADSASATGADVEVEPGPAQIVEGDATALQRLFVNLVDNAVKYGGGARIALSREDGDVVVRVSDNGPGLAPEAFEKVFEPFYRVETSRSRETGGIGLGLSVARTIARAHGGDVTLASKDDGSAGLVATVKLPSPKA
jgi:signal transduction histidine kinase